MIHCPHCNKKHPVVHPVRNRCSCGAGFDGEGNAVDADVPPLVVKSVSSTDFKNKPGSALQSLIPDWVVQFKKGCGCKDMRIKMDRWGTEGCIAKENQIIGHLLQQNDKLIPMFRGVPKSIKKLAAKKLLDKAIKLSR